MICWCTGCDAVSLVTGEAALGVLPTSESDLAAAPAPAAASISLRVRRFFGSAAEAAGSSKANASCAALDGPREGLRARAGACGVKETTLFSWLAAVVEGALDAMGRMEDCEEGAVVVGATCLAGSRAGGAGATTAGFAVLAREAISGREMTAAL